MYCYEWLTGIDQIDPATWDALAKNQDSPYLHHGFLYSLEASGSIAPAAGWHARHALVWEATGAANDLANRRLVAAAVLYLKDHSAGDFCWDFGWAEAAGQNGIAYYPKLVACIPATPSGRYSFLFAEGTDRQHLTGLLIDQIHDCRQKLGACSFQILFPSETFAAFLDKRVFHEWIQSRFNWHNAAYADFEAYLAAFGKNQRRNIRRERQSIGEAGLCVEVYDRQTQPNFEPAETVWRYYKKTNDRFGPWAARFLNRRFFELIFDRAADSLLLITARQEAADQPLAMSFLVRGPNRLFGRYWGAGREISNLHFELCYYAPIEWAIRQGVADFDPGAGSPHKVRRGFLAEPERSFHHFYHAGFHHLFGRYIGQFNRAALAEIEQLNAESPLKDT